MAKKKKRIGVTKAKKKGKYSRFMIYLMIFAMLLSGFYVISWGWSSPNGGEVPLPDMELYDVIQLLGGSNASVEIVTREIKTEIIAQIDFPVYLETVSRIQNTSLDGLEEITLEVGNPEFYTSSMGRSVGGRKYIFFRFTFDGLDDNRTASVRKVLDAELGDENYNLLRGCIGNLPINISGPGTDRVYFPCKSGTEVGDYFTVILFQKTREGVSEGFIGFVRSKIRAGPVIDADVVNITGILVQGIIESDFHPDRLSEINASDMDIVPPRLMVNGTLDNETIEGINSLPDVDAHMEDNKTTISFNNSHGEILGILDEKGVVYELEEGYLLFTVPENANISSVNRTLNESGISNMTFMKVGLVSLPRKLVMDGKLVVVPNNGRFNAILNIETEINDSINFSLSTPFSGEQV
jgi:hypothetical protein